MVLNQTDEEPPIQSINNVRPTGRRAVWFVPRAISAIYLIPIVLVVSVAASSVASGSSYSSGSNLSSYVVLEPKTKISAMRAIDQFTPFVEESLDAEPVVVADVTPEQLILNKPSLAKTDKRPEDVPAEPVKRDSVVVHAVAAGETLSTIAQQYNLNIGSIQVENKELKSIDRLSIGDELRIPPQEYDQSYINKQLEKATKTVAKTNSANRAVVVRGTSTERYSNAGQPAFGRPAGSLGQNGYHSWALDIPPSGGTGIYAAAAGVVVEVAGGWNGGYGNMIKIDHGSGWETLYAHLDSIAVSAGEAVGKGEVLGVMGASGRVYPKGAVHLHFEIRQNGVRLNPINFIN